MRRFLSAMTVLSCTLAILAGLIHIDPFDFTSEAMDRLFGAPPKWTQVTNLYRDPLTQEVTHGDDPVNSLSVLKEYWHQREGGQKVVFMGNSQMHAMSLAPGEQPVTVPEKTYVDLVGDDLRLTNPNELPYRLSSSDMSYPEVFWELNYMLDDPDLRPEIVVLQMNYQAFWAGGIRDSMLPMLRRPSFRKRMEGFSASGLPEVLAYADALRRYDQGKTNNSENPVTNADSMPTSVFNPYGTLGYDLETYVRARLDRLSSEQRRGALRESFEDVLYRGRLYLLQLKPSTARSITGSRLLASRSAVDSIATLCAVNNVRLVLFQAPVNPNVSLYRTSADRESYHAFVSGVAANYRIPLFDFENSIGAQLWGRMLNSPEPLHMGRIAHQQMAKQFIGTVKLVLIRN
jgi:hypothetical protein